MTRWVTATVLVGALALSAAPASAQLVLRGAGTELDFKFLGNASFRITDREITLVSDFPYRSGSFGYMEYDLKDFDFYGEIVLLVTHGHRDHFDKLIYRKKLWTIIGPPDMLTALEDFAAYPAKPSMEYRTLLVESKQTRHRDVEHYSYLVTWHGVRIYFPGDTEDTRHILAAKNLDVAFVTPWLLDSIIEQGEAIDAKKVVLYHHTEKQTDLTYEGVVVLKQNDSFKLPFNETPSE